MKNFVETMKAWLLRWLSPKVAETAKAGENESFIINKVCEAGDALSAAPHAESRAAEPHRAAGEEATDDSAGKDNGDDLHTRLLAFLNKRYELRFNILTEQAEYRVRQVGNASTGGQQAEWRVIDKRAQNTLVMEARGEGINSWDVDMGRLVNSHLVPDYHPMLSYMQHLPAWDGIDRVTPLAHRISTDPLWLHGFTTWLRALAAQWEGRTMQTANMLAPILISRQQGRRKSTFCRMLVPDELQPYYLDRFDPNSKANAEQRLASSANSWMRVSPPISPRSGNVRWRRTTRPSSASLLSRMPSCSASVCPWPTSPPSPTVPPRSSPSSARYIPASCEASRPIPSAAASPPWASSLATPERVTSTISFPSPRPESPLNPFRRNASRPSCNFT